MPLSKMEAHNAAAGTGTVEVDPQLSNKTDAVRVALLGPLNRAIGEQKVLRVRVASVVSATIDTAGTTTTAKLFYMCVCSCAPLDLFTYEG